jgi:hypothetical protein
VEEEEAIGSKLSDGQKLEEKYRKHFRPSGARPEHDRCERKCEKVRKLIK